MPFFRSLVSSLWSRGSASESRQRLALAYQRVFIGSATNEDQELVVVDLADFSGFYRVTPPAGLGGRDEIVFNEGMRAVFGRILANLRISPDEMVSLETAARESAAARAQAIAENQMEG